jgi:hypothetical protein
MLHQIPAYDQPITAVIAPAAKNDRMAGKINFGTDFLGCAVAGNLHKGEFINPKVIGCIRIYLLALRSGGNDI